MKLTSALGLSLVLLLVLSLIIPEVTNKLTKNIFIQKHQPQPTSLKIIKVESNLSCGAIHTQQSNIAMTNISINIIINNINNITTSTFRLSRSRSVLIAEPWPELEGAEQAEASGICICICICMQSWQRHQVSLFVSVCSIRSRQRHQVQSQRQQL